MNTLYLIYFALARAQDDPVLSSIADAMTEYYEDHSTDVGILTVMQSYQSDILNYLRTAAEYSENYSYYTAAIAGDSAYMTSVLGGLSTATVDADDATATEATATETESSSDVSSTSSGSESESSSSAEPESSSSSEPESSSSAESESSSSSHSSSHSSSVSSSHSSSSSGSSSSSSSSSSTGNAANNLALARIFGIFLLL